MALARTDRGTAFKDNGYSSADVVSGSFTPSNNSLLVAIASVEDPEESAWDTNVTASGGSLTWTKRIATNSTSVAAAIFTAPVGTGASMTVTVNRAGGGVGQTYLRLMDFTGYDTSTPTGATASFEELSLSTPDTARSITLSGAPATDSICLGTFVKYNTGESCAPGGSGGFTELFQDELASGWQTMQTQHRTASASTTCDWTFTSVNRDRTCAVALEIKAAAAGGGAVRSPIGTGLTESRFFRKTRLAKAPLELICWENQRGLLVPAHRLAA